MKKSLTRIMCVIALNCLSCSQENEMDKAIDEAMREADFAIDPDLEDKVSIRYYEETRAR